MQATDWTNLPEGKGWACLCSSWSSHNAVHPASSPFPWGVYQLGSDQCPVLNYASAKVYSGSVVLHDHLFLYNFVFPAWWSFEICLFSSLSQIHRILFQESTFQFFLNKRRPSFSWRSQSPHEWLVPVSLHWENLAVCTDQSVFILSSLIES